MRVWLASKTLAESTLRNKIFVAWNKSGLPWENPEDDPDDPPYPCVEVEIGGHAPESDGRVFKNFMEKHEDTLGITRETLRSDGLGDASPVEKLIHIVKLLSTQATRVLNINQEQSKALSEFRTQFGTLKATYEAQKRENEILVEKLAEMSTALKDQQTAAEIFEKEAKDLRKQMDQRGKRLSAHNMQETWDHAKSGDVRFYSEDPKWKNWMLVIKACPACGAAACSRPNRKVGCSHDCGAVSSAGLLPEEWNLWAETYQKPTAPPTDPVPTDNAPVEEADAPAIQAPTEYLTKLLTDLGGLLTENLRNAAEERREQRAMLKQATSVTAMMTLKPLFDIATSDNCVPSATEERLVRMVEQIVGADVFVPRSSEDD